MHSLLFSFISFHLHNLCRLIHWWSRPNRKWLQKYDTSIWIVINVHMGARSLWFPQCAICVNTQIPQAVMATAFESVQWLFFSIFCTIMHALKIVQHILPYLIETIGMHSKLGIRYSSIQTHYATINDFLNNCIFLLFGQYSQKKQITLCSEGTSIFKSKIAYSPWNHLRHQL